MSIGGTHIYIVDDDQAFATSLRRLLNANGILSECFVSARHFLEAVPFDQHGIAIVDIHMPGCTGFDLMKKMKDMHSRMKVVLITGRTEEYSRELALQSGATDFLQKPFTERALLDLIQALDEGRIWQSRDI